MRVAIFLGIEIFFHTLDHLPPHVHAMKPGEWEIRIDLDRTSKANGLIYTMKFPPQKKLPKGFSPLTSNERKQLLKYIVKEKAELLKLWQQKVSVREVI